MMTIFPLELQQDTLQNRKVIFNDSIGPKSDSVLIRIQSDSNSIDFKYDSVPVVKIIQPEAKVILVQKSLPKISKSDNSDTTSVCSRNSIADITFYNPNNFVTNPGSEPLIRFPFLFTEKTRQMNIDSRASLIKHLRPGDDLPAQQLHDDWIIGIILLAAFLFSLLRTASKVILPGITRFFLFKGINDPSSRDADGIFNWQSTISNLFAFLIIGLFGYCVFTYYDFVPAGISGLILWFISFGILITAVTIRHLICVITGNISGEKEVFREYLVAIYQSYRFSALILFAIVILMIYTRILPAEISIITGVFALSTMYLIRVSRLIMIFINQNISIFYLILYLCALEILPVLISTKYFAGLI